MDAAFIITIFFAFATYIYDCLPYWALTGRGGAFITFSHATKYHLK